MVLKPNLVVDQYAQLAFKQAVERPEGMSPSWVPAEGRRRLAAYVVLAAYLENVAREYLRTTDETEKRQHREYGEAELLVHRVVAGLLGDDMQLVVEGADRDLPGAPLVPDEPTDPGPDASPIARAAFDAQSRVWEQRARQAIADWEADWAEQPALIARQEWLREWADSELLHQRVWECENQAVGLGDGVYVLAWSAAAGRPIVRVYDPGFYFPVLDEEAAARGFPTTVYLVWEVDLDGDTVPDHVRRITWRLGPIRPTVTQDLRGRLVPAVRVTTPDGFSFLRPAELEDPTLLDGDRRLADGSIVRRYPWAPDDDSQTTCFMTDATWPLTNANGTAVSGFPDDRATFAVNEEGVELRDLDLRIDFVPVVHVPNTPSSQEHFGRSVLSRVLQLLDDLADSDSDLQSAAALAGTPMVGVTGANVPASLVVAPGAMYGLGPNGSMSALDLSGSVDALRRVIDDLLQRLSVNAQIPAELLGRVDAGVVQAGIAISLKFGPFQALIAVLRLVREQKYRLLLRFVQRLGQAGQVLEPGRTPAAHLAFGSFLPADRKSVIDEVVALINAKAVSRSTGLRLLVAAGVDVESIPDELARIAATDFAGADQLFTATADEAAVRDYLGLADDSPNVPEPPPSDPPSPPAPPAPPAP